MSTAKKALLGLLLVPITLFTAAGVTFYLDAQNRIVDNSIELANEPQFRIKEQNIPARPIWEPYKGEFTMLVIGSDERDGTTNDKSTGVLNDVNLLVHVVEDQSRASVISIPRDLMVEFPQCEKASGGIRQINSALTLGGPDCVVKIVEELSGLEIPHAVLVNFASVVNITNAIGGVPVCLPAALKHHITGEEIAPEGDSVLRGENALDFLRERKTIQSGGDLVRISNQQVFLQNMLIKLNKDGVLTNPGTMIAIANEMLNNLKVSSTLTELPKLVSLGFMLRELGVENIDFYSVPVKAYEPDPNRLALKESAWDKMLADIKTPRIPEDDTATRNKSNEVNQNVDSTTESSQAGIDSENRSTKNADGYYCGLGSS